MPWCAQGRAPRSRRRREPTPPRPGRGYHVSSTRRIRMALAPIYDPEAVAPMWQELAAVGVEPLTTPEQVDEVLAAKSGTVFVIVNSICGCAAGHARPGAMLALQNAVIPDRSVTVFAGVDR